MGKWKIVDNYNEKILSECFNTEAEATRAINERIDKHKSEGSSSDYDAVYFEEDKINMSYQEYVDSIED